MTLNQVIKRIKTLALAHRQVRNFQLGLVSDFLADHTTKYVSVFLQDNGGSISTSKHATTLNYRMFIMDLVNVSEAAKQNELDVISDMVSIAQDLITQMTDPNFQDWRISADNSFQAQVEQDNDMHAGVVIDFSVSFMFTQNKCEVPTDIFYNNPNEEEMPLFDEVYVATGNEGFVLTSGGVSPNIPIINGKKILLITRSGDILYKTSNLPDSTQYVWDNVNILLGVLTNPGERFLILYRNY